MSLGKPPARQPPSLATQLKRQLFLLSLALMLIFLVILHWGLNQLTQDVVLARLERQAANLMSALVYHTEQQSWQLKTERIDEMYHRVHSGAYYYIDSEHVQYPSRSLWDIQLTLETLPLDQQTHHVEHRLQGQTWLVFQQGIQKNNTHFTIWVAEDISELKASIYMLEAALIGVFLFVLGIQVSLQRKIILMTFTRLTPLQDAITAQRMGETCHLPHNTPQEVTPLVEAIQALLQTSSAQIKRSRMALGNLAHELKHPLQHLAYITQEVTNPAQAQHLHAIYQELHYKIERELKRARIAGTPRPGQHFIPDQEILHIVDFLQKMRATPLAFHYQALASQGKTQLPFDRDDMLELFGNLLDNAWRYAHQQVHLTWILEANQLVAQIEEDGEGVAAASLALLTERGVRLDEQTGAGHGLGLSICQAIVESYQGTLKFQASPLGGLQVRVSLPLPEFG